MEWRVRHKGCSEGQVVWLLAYLTFWLEDGVPPDPDRLIVEQVNVDDGGESDEISRNEV